MKKVFTLVLMMIMAASAYSQKSVKWYTLQEAEKLCKNSPRPMFIDTFTDWCGWCKKMDAETFTNPVIADILNTKFYPVKFNAEQTGEVTFLGNKFVNDGKAGNAHQLAVALLQGQLSYPTVVFLNMTNDGKAQVSPVAGFKKPDELEVLLSYFAEKAYETKTLESYTQDFKGKVK